MSNYDDLKELWKSHPCPEGRGWVVQVPTSELPYFNHADIGAEGEIAYEAIREGVGGYIERVPLPQPLEKHMDIWANEEGLLTPDPELNFWITRIVQDAWNFYQAGSEAPMDVLPTSNRQLSTELPMIFGDCFITGRDGKELTKRAMKFIASRIYSEEGQRYVGS